MRQSLRMSEQVGMALHAMAFLAGKEDQWRSVRRMAEALRVSELHLAKVMKLLRKERLVDSVMGPRGGYGLARESARISLLDIYEAVEGKFASCDCLLENSVCAGKKCILGDYLERSSHQFREYLARTKLSELKDLFPQGLYHIK